MKVKTKIKTTLVLYQLTPAEARQELADLLFLADESWSMIERYLPTATIFALRQSDHFIASIVLQSQDEKTLEIMNLAVEPEQQHLGYGRLLIEQAANYGRQNQYQRLSVGTGDASIQNLAFYLHAGFRFAEIRSHFFDQYPQPIIENGLQLRDMIVLDKMLTK